MGSGNGNSDNVQETRSRVLPPYHPEPLASSSRSSARSTQEYPGPATAGRLGVTWGASRRKRAGSGGPDPGRLRRHSALARSWESVRWHSITRRGIDSASVPTMTMADARRIRKWRMVSCSQGRKENREERRVAQ